jgi:glutathione S-transferase
LAQGEQYQPAFTAVNPKSKVPTLVRDDGSILTEFPAIAYWLARSHPEAKLWPEDLETQTRALEVVDYVVATIHMQGFARMFRPGNFTPVEAEQGKVKARGREIFEKGLGLIDKALSGKEYVTGAYSVADSALFYVEFWGGERLNVELPKNCAAHFARMKAGPAVAAVLKQEGFAA